MYSSPWDEVAVNVRAPVADAPMAAESAVCSLSTCRYSAGEAAVLHHGGERLHDRGLGRDGIGGDHLGPGEPHPLGEGLVAGKELPHAAPPSVAGPISAEGEVSSRVSAVSEAPFVLAGMFVHHGDAGHGTHLRAHAAALAEIVVDDDGHAGALVVAHLCDGAVGTVHITVEAERALLSVDDGAARCAIRRSPR